MVEKDGGFTSSFLGSDRADGIGKIGGALGSILGGAGFVGAANKSSSSELSSNRVDFFGANDGAFPIFGDGMMGGVVAASALAEIQKVFSIARGIQVQLVRNLSSFYNGIFQHPWKYSRQNTLKIQCLCFFALLFWFQSQS